MSSCVAWGETGSIGKITWKLPKLGPTNKIMNCKAIDWPNGIVVEISIRGVCVLNIFRSVILEEVSESLSV